MALVHIEECKHLNLDLGEVERIARGLSKYAKQAEKLGLQVFGTSTGGELREHGLNAVIVSELDGSFGGGDGASTIGEDGLLRGEGE